MGIFSKPEVIILKESNDAKEHLDKLESLLPKANKDVKDKIQKEIAVTKAGIAGEDNIMFELKLVDCLEKCLIYGHIRRVAD